MVDYAIASYTWLFLFCHLLVKYVKMDWTWDILAMENKTSKTVYTENQPNNNKKP